MYVLLVPYIKEYTRESRILHEDARYYIEDEAPAQHVERMKIILEGTMFLEKYGDSFKRGKEREIAFLFTLHQNLFNSYYKDIARERAMTQIYEAVRGSQNWYR